MAEENNIVQESDKEAVMNYIKQHIKEIGYCRVGFAIDSTLIKPLGKEFMPNGHREAFQKSVSARLSKIS